MMKKFFENIEKAAEGNGMGDHSFFLTFCGLIVFGCIAVFGLAFFIIMCFKFPFITLGILFLICLIRLIYAGVTGK